MMTHQLYRALSNIRRSLLINTITVVTVTIALLLLAGYLLLLTNLNQWIRAGDKKFHMRAFLVEGLSQQQIEETTQKLRGLTDIGGFQLIDKELARKRFLERHPDFKAITGELEQNPFPATFEISLKANETERIRNVASTISKWQTIEDVDYGEGWFERFIALRGVVRIGSYILGSLIVLACLFLVSNTIRLNIFTRKDEIEIQKLVGGTQLFIATPFLLEGILLGLLSATLAVWITYLFFKVTLMGMSSELQHLTGGVNIAFLKAKSIGLLVGLGMIAGLLGSSLSLRRFLKL